MEVVEQPIILPSKCEKCFYRVHAFEQKTDHILKWEHCSHRYRDKPIKEVFLCPKDGRNIRSGDNPRECK